MEKIDRLGWVDGISFVSYGVKIGIRVNRDNILKDVFPHLPPGWKPSKSPYVDLLYSFIVGGTGSRPGVRRYNILYASLLQLARSMELEPIYQLLESNLQLHVAELSPNKIFVHAGVVGWKGKAIVIPGRSFSGKSTLVASFLKAGATYYSDEYAVFDANGRVHPYPRSLGLRALNSDRQDKFPASYFGAKTGKKALPVGLVLNCEYRSGAKWKPVDLTPGEGALALLANTVPARARPAEALACFNNALSSAIILRGKRDEADNTVRSAIDLLRFSTYRSDQGVYT